jgi:signal transduction histidine kinase
MSQKNRTYKRLEALFSDAKPADPDSSVSVLPKARSNEAPEEARMMPVPESGGKAAPPRLKIGVNASAGDPSIAPAFMPPAAVSPADGWADFLDGIDRGSRMGFAYGQGQLTSLEEAPQSLPERALRVPLMVAGTTIGSLQADGDGLGWSAQQTEIANAAAAQLAQHLDGLRLLARAEKYRAEAELAVRRLTREGWKTFQQTRDEIRTGFVFDQNLVQPLGESGPNGAGELASRSLTVRNESIGELAVDAGSLPGGSLSEGTREILDAVAGQLSGHLENLRLLEQNEKRSHELETVAELSATTSTVLDPARLLQSIVDLTKERFGVYHVHIYQADEDAQTLNLAAGAGEVGRKMTAAKHALPMGLERSLVARARRERQALIVNDVRGEPDFLPNPNLPETRSEMAVPMIVGETVLGVFDVQSDRLNGFTDEDANIYTTLASQVAVALQNARLYMEQAETVNRLRELDRLKTSFLANMSHELRTPLNSILGFTEVMLEGIDGELTETMNNDLGLIRKNGQHLLHLINDVLDMAKISAGKMNISLERFKVHDLLEEVFQISSSLAAEKKLSLMIEADSDRKIEITADRTRIRQVMLNLVSNAVKFTDTGGVSIRTQQKDGKVRIRVSDTGLGIPKEKLDLVFQEFTQVDTSATRKVGGTGLGLPISLSLVQMHGGRLWAESSGIPGEGTTFYVELPVEANVTGSAEAEAAENGKA